MCQFACHRLLACYESATRTSKNAKENTIRCKYFTLCEFTHPDSDHPVHQSLSVTNQGIPITWLQNNINE